MGWFKNVGRAVSKGWRDTTKAAGHAADQVAKPLGVDKMDFLNFAIPGSGVVASGVNSKRHGRGFKQGALASYGNTLKLAGMATGGKEIGSAVTSALPSGAEAVAGAGAAGAEGAAAAGATNTVVNPGVMGKIGAVLNSAKGAMKNDKGGFDWGKLGKVLIAASAFKGQRDDASRANKRLDKDDAMRDMFLKMAQDRDAENAPYRQKAMEMLMKLGKGGPASDYLHGG